MEDKQPVTNTIKNEEIDLGQLFVMIGTGFKKIFEAFLKLFLYLKRNMIWLIVLGVVGLGIAIGLNQFFPKQLKTEVIVKPNLESKNYLYDVVNEIQSNIQAKDSAFFKNMGIEPESIKGFLVTIEPVGNKTNDGADLEYLKILEKFQNSGVVSDVLRAEILEKGSLNHRITFYYKDALRGQDCTKKLVSYINSNKYYNDLVSVYQENAKERIEKNEILVGQIDDLIAKYTEKMAEPNNQLGDGKIVLNNEEKLNITGLFSLKNDLIQDIESKRLELVKRKEAISIINFGMSHQVQKPLFAKNIIRIPIILISIFFLISIIKYLNKKAVEIRK